MTAVIIRYSLEVVPDETIHALTSATRKAGDDRIEIPGLPGITFQQITGIFRGYSPLALAHLVDEIAVAMNGDPPTRVLLVREGDIP